MGISLPSYSPMSQEDGCGDVDRKIGKANIDISGRE